MWTLVTLGLLLVFANFGKRSMQFKQTFVHLKQPSTIATALLNNKSHETVLSLEISWYCLIEILNISLNACFRLRQIIKKLLLFIMIFLYVVFFCLSSFRIELTVDSRYLFYCILIWSHHSCWVKTYQYFLQALLRTETLFNFHLLKQKTYFCDSKRKRYKHTSHILHIAIKDVVKK